MRTLLSLLALNLLFFAPNADSSPSDVTYILRAGRIVTPDMVQLERRIRNLEIEELNQEVVIEKLISIASWKRSFSKNYNLYLRRVKRAATDRLRTVLPLNDQSIKKLASSLDHELMVHHNEQLVIDSSNYALVAELLCSWSYQGNEVASEELVKGLESSIHAKVLETQLAMSITHANDYQWLEGFDEARKLRIEKALGRPWVVMSLRNSYENELRFQHHYLKQLIRTFYKPTLASLADLEASLSLGVYDKSYFSFFQSLLFLNDLHEAEGEKISAAKALAEGIERLIEANPELRNNIFAATLLFESIEKFTVHSPYVDKLVAYWLEAPFIFHNKETKGTLNLNEKALAKNLRREALRYLIHIQQNYFFAQHAAPFENQPEEVRKIVYFDQFSRLLRKSFTALDPEALSMALGCESCDPKLKLALIDHFMMSDKTLQDLVIHIAASPAAQEKALHLLNGVKNLDPHQMNKLGTIIGIHFPDEAQLYLADHTNLKRMFETEWHPPQIKVGLIGRTAARLSNCARKLATAAIRRAIQ